jgi:hypothetical protein
MLTLIGNIYEARRFCVADGAIKSSERKQMSGISQGCPLSPFLFVMLMTVVLREAVNNLSDNDKFDMVSGSLSVLLYADDTLLIGRSQASLQNLLDNIALAGVRVGMELHWDKFQMIKINSDVTLRTPAGQLIAEKRSMTYLGATLYNDGQLGTELNKRIGAAWAEFSKYDSMETHCF